MNYLYSRVHFSQPYNKYNFGEYLMQVVPALDLKGNHCIHSHRDENIQDIVTIKENPFDAAKRWADAGAKRLHLSDMDGFRSQEPENVHLVRELCQEFKLLEIQIAGGVKNEEHVDIWLDAGVDYVIAGCRTFQHPDFLEGMCTEFPDKIMLSVDLRDGQWAHSCLSNYYGTQLAQMTATLAAGGLAGLMCTNTNTAIDSPHFHYLQDLPDDLEMPVYINGGLYNTEDVKELKQLKVKAVSGIIVGRVIYDDILDFRELVNEVQTGT